MMSFRKLDVVRLQCESTIFYNNAIRTNLYGVISRVVPKQLSQRYGTTTAMPSMTPYNFGDVVLVAYADYLVGLAAHKSA